MKCNVCGEKTLLDTFRVQNDFGYSSDLDSMSFEFSLCQHHVQVFLAKGSETNHSFREDDWTCFSNVYFDSKTILDFMSSFVYVPTGYYNNTWLLYTDEEEQLMWETNLSPLEVLSYERILEIGDVFETETISSILQERFPDHPNPFAKYNEEQFDAFLDQLTKEELLTYVKKHASKENVYAFFSRKK